MFPNQSLCDDLFNQRGKYDEEHAKDTTAIYPEVYWTSDLHGLFLFYSIIA
jgi:hypothetical protein